MKQQPLKINIQSEIGKLNAVLLHSPGAEVENMTPRNAQRALYSDILNLSIAQREYEQLSHCPANERQKQLWAIQQLQQKAFSSQSQILAEERLKKIKLGTSDHILVFI